MRICLEVRAPSSTSCCHRIKDFHYLHLGVQKRYNPYTRGEHEAKTQSQSTKQVTSTSEGRHKAKTQSNEKDFTTLGDHKDYKQHLSLYKILEDKFCNE